jgi:hypothetical protein
MQGYDTGTTNGSVAVEVAVAALRNNTDYDPAFYRIRAIKNLRAMTALRLKEAKDVVDAAFPRDGEDVSLEAILADLKRREGRDDAPAASVGDVAIVRDVEEARRERKRQRDRERRARIRAELNSLRPPTRPTTVDLAWSLVATVPSLQLRAWLESNDLTIEIVRRTVA